jgi:nucleoside-diphosphate-sugar epimerase
MKSILLIGGAGYIGTVISSHFLKKGYQVNVLDNFIYDHQFAVYSYIGDPSYKLFHGDICDIKVIERAVEGVSDVIILAGLVGDPITKKYPDESGLINDRGVKNCMDLLSGKGIQKVIFVSTCSNYGLIRENELADEEFDLNPLSLYAKAKVDNERYLLAKKGKVDYSGVILRFATAFGLSPRMRFDLSVSEFVRDLYTGKELMVYDQDTWRPYCHVRDFARLIDIVINAEKGITDFEIFNAGGEVNNFTKRMIVDEIVKHVQDAQVKFGTNGSDPRNYRVSFSKVRNKLGFTPDHTVHDGISELIKALQMGFYSDSIQSKNKYGNFEIRYIMQN